MLSKYVSRTGSRRLILVYADWGMDWRPFRSLERAGYDVLVIWDYTELTFSWRRVMADYDEICLVAWGIGVFAASLTAHETMPHVTKRVAINGTLMPVSDVNGMADSTFRQLIDTLSPGKLRKYCRQMCANERQFEAFWADRPQRTVASMRAELEAIETASIFHAPQIEDWDLAIVGRHDAIVSMENQAHAWRQLVPVQFMNAGHLPDLQMLISRLVINKDRVAGNFAQAHDVSDVQPRIARRLYDLFRQTSELDELVGDIIEVGPGRGNLTQLYAPHHRAGTLSLWDLAPQTGECPQGARFEQCDAEVAMRRRAAESATFIFTSSTAQWFNSANTFMRACARVLKPGGWLVLSAFTRENLPELSQVLGAGLLLPSASGWTRMLTSDMELLACRDEAVTLHFDNPRQVLEYLRDVGVNGVDYGHSPVSLARRVLTQYPVDVADGTCTLTYRPVYIIARKLTRSF